jgi:probable rRNA maturation factor
MKKRSNPIKLHLQTPSQEYPSRVQFLCWIRAVVPSDAVELTIRITDEQESAELNRKYRGKFGPTNVLSFSVESSLNEPCPYLGDLVICAPLVIQEAQQQNKLVINHWAHLTIHGVLHLLGYDHEQEQEAEIMEELEAQIMQRLGLPDPYDE